MEFFRTGSAGSVGTERMRITDDNGYVGIGTSSPSAQLHVKASSAAVGTPAISIENTPANNSLDPDQNRPVTIKRAAHG